LRGECVASKYIKVFLFCQGLGLIFIALASFCKQVFTFFKTSEPSSRASAGYGEEALQKQSGILDFRIFLIF